MYQKANKVAEEFLTPEAIENFYAKSFTQFAEIQQMHLTEEQKKFVKEGNDIQEVLLPKKDVTPPAQTTPPAQPADKVTTPPIQPQSVLLPQKQEKP